MIDRIFQTVKTLINTDGRGNFDPSDFNLILFNAIQERYESYITEINQQVNRENRGLINGGLENVPERIREKLQHYLTMAPLVKTAGLFTLPATYKFFDTITNAEGIEYESCKNNQEFNILKTTVANSDFPIYLKLGNTIRVQPDVAGPLTIYFLRKPLFPKWTYVKMNNAELFNPSAIDFQDVDIHPSEEDNLTAMVCLKFGINLKETDLQTTMQNASIQETNKQNAS
jgi:hypothetical protein